MELYFKGTGDITYKSELIPMSVLKFSLKILAHFANRDMINNLCPSRKHCQKFLVFCT